LNLLVACRTVPETMRDQQPHACGRIVPTKWRAVAVEMAHSDIFRSIGFALLCGFAHPPISRKVVSRHPE
jgi:hypothetical protein